MSHWESSGKSNDWFTPKYIFDALGCTFDIDVAAACSPHACVPTHGQIFNRSLETQWLGFVWMNPPFGGRNSLEAWLDKFFEHGDGIALTPDRTSAPWFQKVWTKADAVLFLPKVRFIRPDGSTGNSPSNGTALWAAGPRAVEVLHRGGAVGLGILARPIVAEARLHKAAA